MEYLKFNIDEMTQQMVFCEYREITAESKKPTIVRAFPLDKIADAEPKINELIAGDIIGIYYERKNKTIINEEQYLDENKVLDQETIDWIETFVKRACLDEEWDELLKPPTVDQQVEDFIKEFFEEEEDEPLEQKDFLAEFFAELEAEETKE